MLKLQKFFSMNNSDNHRILNVLGVKFKFKSKSLMLDMMIKKIAKQEQELNIIKKSNAKQSRELNLIRINNAKQKQDFECCVNRITPQPILKSTVYHLADNCNLNCWGCDHFAPLARKKFANIEIFKADMKRFSELLNQGLGILKLMGGEPLLNVQIIDFMDIARNYFPQTKIEVVTNGILLPIQKENFWEACKRDNIVIVITKYPLKIKYEKIQEKAQKYDVKIEFYGSTGEVLKTSYHIPLDIKGEQQPVNNFINCFHANNCVMLKNGRLYPCTVAPNIEHFNKYFGYNLELTEKDGIDIYKAETGEELLEFLSRPMPFCRYCNVKGRTFNHPWQQSKRELSEWVICE